MPQRGPVPLGALARGVKGNPAGRPIDAELEADSSGGPRPPSEWPNELKKTWRGICKAAPPDLLGRVDAGILAIYVFHFHAWRAIAAQCGTDWMQATKHADAMDLHERQMLAAAGRLGFDPGTRARIRVPVEAKTKEPSLFDRLRDTA